MPEVSLSIPIVGNRWAVGAAFQMHLVFVAFIMGIAIMAPLAESLGRRQGGERWERLAHELSLTIVRFFSFAATWAVLALVLLFALYPRLFGVLTSVFFWPLVVVSGIWLIMTSSAYMYYYTWESQTFHGRLHTAIGWTFAGSSFVFISLISGLSSYQLTPTESGGPFAAYLNPSWLTEIIHRHIGNLSYAGFLLASYAGVRFLFSKGELEARAYYDWLGHLGVMLGIGLALLQPIAGWFYARQILSASPVAFVRMMVGENSWMFLVQAFLFGAVLFLGNLYLALALKRASPTPKGVAWARNSIWAIGLLVVLGVVPKEWPLGQMTPWKYISLAGLVLLSFVNLLRYVRARRGFIWGKVGRGSQTALAIIGVAIVALMVIMGTIREGARGSDLIYRRLGPDQSQQFEQP